MPEVNHAIRTIYSLQLLRFIASLFVVFFHLGLMASGYKGVDIFFVISGFVMYYTTFIAERSSGVVFVVHRLTKIYFLYWIILLICYFVEPFNIDMAFLKTLFLLPGHTSILGFSWSLSFELYFYFLFGTIVYIIDSKFQKWAFLSLLIIATAITILNVTSLTVKGSILNFLAGQNLWEFLLGILCAYVFERCSITKYMAGLGAVVMLLSITILSLGYAKPISYIVYGTLSFMSLVFLTLFEKIAPFNAKAAQLMKKAGDASYAIYLTGPVIGAFVKPTNFLRKIIVVVIIIITALIINQLFENRLLRLSRRVLLKNIGNGKAVSKMQNKS